MKKIFAILFTLVLCFSLLIACEKGADGKDGINGKSAYQIWLDAGNEGSEAEFLDSLKGNSGDKGDKGDKGDSATEEFKYYQLGDTFTYINMGIPLFSVTVAENEANPSIPKIIIKNLNVPYFYPGNFIDIRGILNSGSEFTTFNISNNSKMNIGDEIETDAVNCGDCDKIYIGLPVSEGMLPYAIFEMN